MSNTSVRYRLNPDNSYVNLPEGTTIRLGKSDGEPHLDLRIEGDENGKVVYIYLSSEGFLGFYPVATNAARIMVSKMS